MNIKKKSLYLKKFKIANLNQALIIGGTGGELTSRTTPAQTESCVYCNAQSDPVLTVCTSIGHLKSLELEGGTCKGEVVNSHQPSGSEGYIN